MTEINFLKRSTSKLCNFCSNTITPAECVFCPDCGDPYHENHWRENGNKCLVKNCPGSTKMPSNLENLFFGIWLRNKNLSDTCKNCEKRCSILSRYCHNCGMEINSVKIRKAIASFSLAMWLRKYFYYVLCFSALLLLGTYVIAASILPISEQGTASTEGSEAGDEQDSSAKPTPTITPSTGPTRSPATVPTKTPATVSRLYDCNYFIDYSLVYSVEKYSEDYLTVHQKDSIGYPKIQSVELVTGQNNPAYSKLEQIHSAVYCFLNNAEARVHFDRVEGAIDPQLGSYQITSKSLYGTDKYQIWFIDSNIVVQIKGKGRYSLESSAVETETLNQAIDLYQKIRSIPKVDSLEVGYHTKLSEF